MANYIYGWDSVNKKKVYMGKYSGKKLQSSEGTAGIKHYKGVGGKPDKRSFIGSGIEEYTFSNEIQGTHTIPAESFEEALRIAISMGFTQDDYKKR